MCRIPNVQDHGTQNGIDLQTRCRFTNRPYYEQVGFSPAAAG